MAIPRIQTNMVDLANLQPGVRYTFTKPDSSEYMYEGTFNKVIDSSRANDGHAQYVFSNVSKYTRQGTLIEKSELTNFANPESYPSDIFVYNLPKLPNKLNQYIRSFGGKSRKTNRRRNRKSKRSHRKSKRSHRKSKKC
jgi:hypothetical protein